MPIKKVTSHTNDIDFQPSRKLLDKLLQLDYNQKEKPHIRTNSRIGCLSIYPINRYEKKSEGFVEETNHSEQSFLMSS